MDGTFTEPARKEWKKIRKDIRDKLLSNVHCTNCETMTTIVDYEGKIKRGDLVLNGECKSCGGKVTRLIELD